MKAIALTLALLGFAVPAWAACEGGVDSLTGLSCDEGTFTDNNGAITTIEQDAEPAQWVTPTSDNEPSSGGGTFGGT